MKTTTFKLVLGVAALAGPLLAATTAGAGDYNGGGLKGMRGTYVPVPAPAPIPEYHARWYLRADVGAGFGVGMKSNESGMRYGDGDLDGTVAWPGGYDAVGGPFGIGDAPFSNLSWDEGDDIGHIFGAGIGYYISPTFRIDLTGDIRSEKKNSIHGNFEYDLQPGSGVVVRGDVEDTTTYRSSIFMANGYYDFNRTGRWNPYLGAGLGFAVNELQRSHRTNFTECDTSIPFSCDTPVDIGSYNEKSGKDYTYSLAASVMAGLSYRISDTTALDFNYRYLYVGGTDKSLTINGFNSVVDIDDQHEHYLRAGLRWDIK